LSEIEASGAKLGKTEASGVKLDKIGQNWEN